MYVCMYVCMNECIYVCMYACTHARTHTCMCVYIYIYICMYVCMYVCMYGKCWQRREWCQRRQKRQRLNTWQHDTAQTTWRAAKRQNIEHNHNKHYQYTSTYIKFYHHHVITQCLIPNGTASTDVTQCSPPRMALCREPNICSSCQTTTSDHTQIVPYLAFL